MVARDKIFIYGRHALTEALEHKPESVRKVFLAPNVDDPKLRELLSRAKIVPAALTSNKGPVGVESDASHQGVIAQIAIDSLVVPYESFIKELTIDADTALVVLGEVQDPHNVGAIIRSAAAFGVSGVLIPEHNQAPVTGTVVKVSAGMAFRIPLVSIGNVNHSVRDLKERGFWVYGLAGEGANPLPAEKFDAPTLFVLGNEAKGIREKTRDLCDTLISIPMHPQCESLNVAASTAVALYAWSNQHSGALKK